MNGDNINTRGTKVYYVMLNSQYSFIHHYLVFCFAKQSNDEEILSRRKSLILTLRIYYMLEVGNVMYYYNIMVKKILFTHYIVK